MKVKLAIVFGLVVFSPAFSIAQSVADFQSVSDAQLRYVVVVSRHGVRSPTGKSAQYNQYSTSPWPTWDVPPGYLTAHGFQLMQIFGSYDRQLLESEHLFAPGCADAAHVTIYADSDQRTRETGRALAAGLFPGCSPSVLGRPEGTNDPLFHPTDTGVSPAQAALATAALAGRIGNNPAALSDAYHTQLAALDHILSTCGQSPKPHPRLSIFDIPVSLTPGSGDHAAELRGPLSTASTLTENILLEYTQGMESSDVGWGCIGVSSLRSLIDLHTASSDVTQRTTVVAALQASNLLTTIDASLQQAAKQSSVAGALGKPEDRALFLVGHDTNLSNIAGLLALNWLSDGRRDDTPPGSALVFELWQSDSTKKYSVRVFFTAQTLEQMRSATVLSPQNPPSRVPVFVPGCSSADFSCRLPDLSRMIHVLTSQSN